MNVRHRHRSKTEQIGPHSFCDLRRTQKKKTKKKKKNGDSSIYEVHKVIALTLATTFY